MRNIIEYDRETLPMFPQNQWREKGSGTPYNNLSFNQLKERFEDHFIWYHFFFLSLSRVFKLLSLSCPFLITYPFYLSFYFISSLSLPVSFSPFHFAYNFLCYLETFFTFSNDSKLSSCLSNE